MKNTQATSALANIVRGRFRVGLRISPTWQAAVSKAGATKPIRKSPAITLVMLPNQPSNGVLRWRLVACCQSTVPAATGPSPERNARTADPLAIGIASRAAQRTPSRLTAVKNATMPKAAGMTGNSGRYQSRIAVAASSEQRPAVGTQPHQ